MNNNGLRELTEEELENVVAGVSKEVLEEKKKERQELESFANLTEEQYDTYLAHSTETKEVSSMIKDVMAKEKISDSDSELARMINDVGEKYDLDEHRTK